MSISRTSAIRHAVAVLLLCAAWNRLSLWYGFQHPVDYLAFAACFVAAAGLASLGCIQYARAVSRLRLALAAGILLLALPWGEWLQLALPDAREDWSRQLLLQGCFLYAGFVILQLLPRLRQFLKDRVLHFLDRFSTHKLFPAFLAILFFCFTSWIAVVAFHKILVIQDAAAHMFQAKIFRAGRLYAQAPPVPEAFERIGDMLVLREGRWFSIYLPGFSLLLAASMLFRFEWLLCPALGAGTVALWIAYTRRWHDRRSAALLGVLCLFSPTFFLMHASTMVHAAEVFFISAIIYLCRRESEEPSGRRRWLPGSDAHWRRHYTGILAPSVCSPSAGLYGMASHGQAIPQPCRSVFSGRAVRPDPDCLLPVEDNRESAAGRVRPGVRATGSLRLPR